MQDSWVTYSKEIFKSSPWNWSSLHVPWFSVIDVGTTWKNIFHNQKLYKNQDCMKEPKRGNCLECIWWNHTILKMASNLTIIKLSQKKTRHKKKTSYSTNLNPNNHMREKCLAHPWHPTPYPSYSRMYLPIQRYHHHITHNKNTHPLPPWPKNTTTWWEATKPLYHLKD
jgi:hypothetical protein